MLLIFSKQNRGLQLIQEVQDLLNSKQFQPKVRRTPLYRRNNINKQNSQVDRPATTCKLTTAGVDQQTPRSRRSRRSLVDCKPVTRSNNFPVTKRSPRHRSLNTGCMPHGAALASQAYEEAKLQSSNVETQEASS
ncbi:uncharacterized protein [Anabrus simplex]|uniref:uncharacterized protein n=1 Tax=Anabrus simplex TaxID=316456 RepID=UPI0034DD3736